MVGWYLGSSLWWIGESLLSWISESFKPNNDINDYWLLIDYRQLFRLTWLKGDGIADNAGNATGSTASASSGCPADMAKAKTEAPTQTPIQTSLATTTTTTTTLPSEAAVKEEDSSRPMPPTTSTEGDTAAATTAGVESMTGLPTEEIDTVPGTLPTPATGQEMVEASLEDMLAETMDTWSGELVLSESQGGSDPVTASKNETSTAEPMDVDDSAPTVPQTNPPPTVPPTPTKADRMRLKVPKEETRLAHMQAFASVSWHRWVVEVTRL